MATQAIMAGMPESAELHRIVHDGQTIVMAGRTVLAGYASDDVAMRNYATFPVGCHRNRRVGRHTHGASERLFFGDVPHVCLADQDGWPRLRPVRPAGPSPKPTHRTGVKGRRGSRHIRRASACAHRRTRPPAPASSFEMRGCRSAAVLDEAPPIPSLEEFAEVDATIQEAGRVSSACSTASAFVAKSPRTAGCTCTSSNQPGDPTVSRPSWNASWNLPSLGAQTRWHGDTAAI